MKTLVLETLLPEDLQLYQKETPIQGFSCGFWGIFEENLWTTVSASRILHSSKQHYISRCRIKQNSNKSTKKHSLKLRGSPSHIPDQKQKNMRQILFFNKVTGLRPATLLKKGLWQRCLPAKLEKFLRTSFYKEQFRWLLLFCLPYGGQMKYKRFIYR